MCDAVRDTILAVEEQKQASKHNSQHNSNSNQQQQQQKQTAKQSKHKSHSYIEPLKTLKPQILEPPLSAAGRSYG